MPGDAPAHLTSIPSGDAMSVRYHRDADAARLKLEPVRRPVAWEIHPDDKIGFAAWEKHCETRRCRSPVSVVTWRFWRSAEAGRVLLSEHLACTQHGTEFAARHHITIDPARGRASSAR